MELSDSDSIDHAFPYPVNITRDDFAKPGVFDADAFLHKNHRYTSLDSLLADLTLLSKSLNQDLLDLVNEEYTNFIKLGQSIGQCSELIDNTAVEVGRFKAVVEQVAGDFATSAAATHRVLEHKRQLNLLKNKAKLILLLHEQCTSFETLLALDVANTSSRHLQAKLATLATLYLSVTKIFSMLMQATGHGALSVVPSMASVSLEPKKGALNGASSAALVSLADDAICVFFDKVVKSKVVLMKFEFKLYLDELMKLAKTRPHDYDGLVLQLLQIYRVTGKSSDAVKLLQKK